MCLPRYTPPGPCAVACYSPAPHRGGGGGGGGGREGTRINVSILIRYSTKVISTQSLAHTPLALPH